MKRISLIVCAVLGIAGCGKSVSTDVLVVDDDDAVEVVFEDVATDIRIVPLISDEPIGGCSELHCYGNEVFMSDKSTEYLYYFVDGKLVSTLHAVGRGPGEYNIIDQCVAQGVPFAREYGGLLDNRSFGGAQVSRTFYAKGQTGQQLLLGAYSALSRQIGKGKVKMYTRYEMLDIVLIPDENGEKRARGIIARNLVTGRIERFFGHAVVIGSGGYGNTFFLSTNAMASNGSAAMQMYRHGA